MPQLAQRLVGLALVGESDDHDIVSISRTLFLPV